MKRFNLATLSVCALMAFNGTAQAEAVHLRLAQQFGIGYMPLTIMQHEGLLEKNAKAAGLELTTEWLSFTGGSGMNEALLSGNLDIASGGTTPMLTIWARTQKNLKVKGIAALASMPLHMMTSREDMKTLADVQEGDKIALPAVKTSIQAITLQMAAEKYLGEGKHGSLDAFTVSMGHPDGLLAMTGGRSEINTHFTSPPFQNIEAATGGIHKVVDSYEVLDGSHSFTVIWAKSDFVENNPEVMKVLMQSLEESIEVIRNTPEKAAEIWATAETTNLTKEQIVALIQDPQTNFTTTPERLVPYVNYMARAGLIAADTSDWRDLFFETVADKSGS